MEEALAALGVALFPMVELEADDALAAAATAAADPRVEQVVIMTPDKDLAQMVLGTRVVQFDRRAKVFTDEAGVQAKYGVLPESIPDWLALVGDSADGFPGLPGWGKTSASAVLARYFHIEEIPEHHFRWDVTVRGAARLAGVLNTQRDLALLFRDLATLRSEAPVLAGVDDIRWAGPTDGLEEMATRLRAWRFMERVAALDPR
ncbi:MAG: 5'-3' exonuclease H3TH domain-containing protein [Acidimicrobiales bacterium]